jgi:lysophospholipid acyltransferase (LPLAT)-like uncharacterized protein
VFPLLWYLYLSFVALTSRIRLTSQVEGALVGLRERRPSVYTFWFEDVLFLLYFFGVRRLPILMTPKGRTDMITKIAQWMGLKVAIGSLEGGGRHALVTLLEHLKTGSAIVLAADGSRGPARKCKAGCFMLAQEAGAPLVPIVWKALFRMPIPRKDGKIWVPLPFNSIEVRLGAPITISKHYNFNELENVKGLLTTQLNRLGE